MQILHGTNLYQNVIRCLSEIQIDWASSIFSGKPGGKFSLEGGGHSRCQSIKRSESSFRRRGTGNLGLRTQVIPLGFAFLGCQVFLWGGQPDGRSGLCLIDTEWELGRGLMGVLLWIYFPLVDLSL